MAQDMRSKTPRYDVLCYVCGHEWESAYALVCPLCNGQPVTIHPDKLRIRQLESELAAANAQIAALWAQLLNEKVMREAELSVCVAQLEAARGKK